MNKYKVPKQFLNINLEENSQQKDRDQDWKSRYEKCYIEEKKLSSGIVWKIGRAG
jgi:hypothetical protein